MQNAEPTLHDFVLKLLTEAPCRQAFDLDPVAALRDAGFSDVSPQDVVDAIPLVMDFASASGGFPTLEGHAWAGPGGVAGWGGVTSPFGGGSAGATVSPEGIHSNGGFGSPHVGGGYEFDAGLDGVSGSGEFGTALGGGAFEFAGGTNGFDGGLALHGRGLDGLGLDSDALGRGGDLVTGTVAGYLTDNANSLSGALTDGAGVLSGGLSGGADTAGGVVSDGAQQVADAVQDPTSIHVPAVTPSGLPELPVELPVDVPDMPQLPEAPGLPGLPDLSDLPVDLPELPVQLPELPGMPEVPGLPSAPGVGNVQDVVGGVTGNVPVVSDLTDGLGEGLLGH